MSELIFLFRQGWRSIWRQRLFWVFSALPVLDQAISALGIKLDEDLPARFLVFAGSLLSSALSLVSFIAVPYLAYCFWLGKPVTLRETLLVVRSNAFRVIGCSCLGMLILSPCLFLVLSLSMKNSSEPGSANGALSILLLVASVFSAMWDFTLAGFFASGWGIRQSLSKAWDLFTRHFNVLAIAGIVLGVLFRIHFTLSALLAALAQSGTDLAPLHGFDLIYPSALLTRSLPFVLANGVGQVIFVPLSASVFMLAYLRYSGLSIRSIDIGERANRPPNTA